MFSNGEWSYPAKVASMFLLKFYRQFGYIKAECADLELDY